MPRPQAQTGSDPEKPDRTAPRPTVPSTGGSQVAEENRDLKCEGPEASLWKITSIFIHGKLQWEDLILIEA